MTLFCAVGRKPEGDDGTFVECGRRGLKIKAYKSRVKLLGGKEGLECEIHVDGTRLEQVSDQNSNICGVFWMNEVQVLQSVIVRWRVGGKLQVL